MNDHKWEKQLYTLLEELNGQAGLEQHSLLVVGASTSEIAGSHIGSAGSADIAKALVRTVETFREKIGFSVAYQGCEHINRALVVDRDYALRQNLEIVRVAPCRSAGGAAATFAYENNHDQVVVEHVQADAGIDIGDTLIGMHLKHVAVPVRGSIRNIGQAHVTMARTRPKYIGGPRARY